MRELMEQPPCLQGTVNLHLHKGCSFYYTDVESTIAYLLRQRTFSEHLVYEPVPEFDGDGNTVFTEMNIGD